MNQDKFTQYGKTFQLKIIAALIKDKGFLQQIFDILLPSYFDSEANSWIVEVIMKYYVEYKAFPDIALVNATCIKIRKES